ncbi:hypothetical protein C8Q75DRAFT_803351 [Abortiporus biennis]|nr:hypothetical protein C8Q75DRAFT_803351 [Abortiporus biennis]
MSLSLPVSSFPDVSIIHPPPKPLEVDLKNILTGPHPTKRRRKKSLGCLFANRNPTFSDSNTPERHSESIERAVNITGSRSHTPDSCRLDSSQPFEAHGSRDILFPQTEEVTLLPDSDPIRQSLLWTDDITYCRPPRSTKESIASLGLAGRSTTPDCALTTTDSGPAIAYCCTSNFFKPQTLPPLPPLPPPESTYSTARPVQISMADHRHAKMQRRRSSTVGDESRIRNDLQIEVVSVIHKDDIPSTPPSPITFSCNRRGSYIAVHSSEVNDDDDTTTRGSYDTKLSSTSNLQRRAKANNPFSISRPPRKSNPVPPVTRPPPPSPVVRQNTEAELPLDFTMMAHPWMRAFPTAHHHMATPRPKKPKVVIPVSAPTTNNNNKQLPPPSAYNSPSKLNPMNLMPFKLFRRPRSSAGQRTDFTSGDSPSRTRDTRRNSVHVFGQSTNTMSRNIGAQLSSSSHTLAYHGGSQMGGQTESDEEDDTPSIVTHHAVGDVWREKNIDEVIPTLRSLKAAKLKE